ncbi:replication protein [Thermoflavimicrobium daqui]|jgi:hypothetical protein|uniref:Bacteriophage lambda Replication protein O N-terminal domain-containing protein n=1 Tax=Thermoflavimicrobium daqui TaxID=2137476 RepID=A0A364K0H3_9BACL|nr:replication protein [Thermoflavimicrobium daqui]RAL20837.1 hypothetical protein DL897_17720 [Thermoflavimicrobium daqui]
MANPQPDQFIKLSMELQEAIMKSDFSKRQRNILDLVIRLSYGCGKKYALLRPSDFQLCGVGKNHIKSELEYLVQTKVLFVNGEQIALNKNYDEWRISIVKKFDQSKWMEVLKKNLSHIAVPETGTEVPKMGTDEIEEFPKQEPKSSRNRNQKVPKTGTDTNHDPYSDAEFQPPIDNIKINIDKEDRKIEEKDDPIFEIENLFIQRRGIGIIPSSDDYKSIYGLIADEIPLEDILFGINYAFDNFKPKHSRDRIRSFSYCETVIRDLYARKQAKVKAQQKKERSNNGYASNETYDGGSNEANPDLEKEISCYYDQFPGLFAN